MDAQTLFLVHIMDGYSFRNTIGIIKNETDYATMVLSPNGIEISFINTSKCAIHKIVLDTRELTMYRYNFVDEKGHPVGKEERKKIFQDKPKDGPLAEEGADSIALKERNGGRDQHAHP